MRISGLSVGHNTEEPVLVNDPGLKAALVACASKGALVGEHG
jgi:hypothetical protein